MRAFDLHSTERRVGDIAVSVAALLWGLGLLAKYRAQNLRRRLGRRAAR
jgi:hypothetical protein